LALGDVTTGNNNSAFGANSGRGVTTGTNNTIIGANITGLTATLSDTLIIATGAGGTASYRIFSPSSGNILIGTTVDAGFKLDVNGSARISGNLTFTGNRTIGTTASGDSLTIGIGSAAHLFFNVNGNNVGRFSNNGEFQLLGTNRTITCVGDASTTVGGIVVFTPVYGANTGFSLVSTGGNQRLNYTGQLFFLSSATNFNSAVEHTRVTNSGNWLFGTTTDAGFRLDVVGTSRIRSAASGLDSNLLIESTTNEKFALLSLKSGSGSTWALGACNYQFSNAFIIRSGAIGTERFAIFPTTGNVSIGTTTDVASSILTLSSTTKGFLPPRMTTAQRDAIVSPDTGLVLFNTTTDTLQVRASTGWINL
jgi:hypothetical protein